MTVIKYNPTLEEFMLFFRDLYKKSFINYSDIDYLLKLNATKYGFENKLDDIKKAVKCKEDIYLLYPEI